MPHNEPRLDRFPHVCIVEASAGTGKTYALARRYIQLLMGAPYSSLRSPRDKPGGLTAAAPFKSILAITFSNKAVLEMKERILYLLKRLALDGFTDPAEREELLRELGLGAQEARVHASRCMNDLIYNYNFFQVQTIDSFMNAILSGCAFHLGLSSSFRIRRDWPEFLAFSLDTLIDRASQDKSVRRLFDEALRQYLYLESRSGWFPKRDMFKMMKDLFSAMNRKGSEIRTPDVTAGELAALKKKIIRDMVRLQRVLPKATHKQFVNSLSDFLFKTGASFDFDGLSRYWLREEPPVSKKARVPVSVDRLWKGIRLGLEEAAVQESLLIYKPYADMFTAVLKELRQDVAREDVLFLDELNFRAQQLVGQGAVSLPELYYRLAVRLRHFLVDEFQDTSPLQWKNLDAMVEEALSTGGSLFYVGDKKQAIYRFRGGDVRLFDSLRGRFASFPVLEQSLSLNRRSRCELVRFCNGIFSQVNLDRFLSQASFGKSKSVSVGERQDILGVFEGARQDVLKEDSGGFVHVETVAADSAEERGCVLREKVFGVLEEVARRGYGWEDVAVLVRENDGVECVSEWLLGHGIPVSSEKTLNIRNHPRIKEVISLLRFLNKPVDDLAFVAFILGDIFSHVSGLPREEMSDFVFSRPGRGSRGGVSYLYRSFRTKYAALWAAYFDGLFKSVGFVPLYELVVRIYAQFRCFESYGDDQGFFMRLLELIKEREEESAALTDFLEFFDTVAGEELYLKGMTASAVKVMTIHKAKGLGFPVVILPFLSIRPRVDAMAVQETDEGLLLRRIGGKYAGFSRDLDVVGDRERLRSLVDEMNSVYVGLTRACDAMWIFLPHGAKKAANPLVPLFSEETISCGRIPRKREENSAEGRVVPINLPHYGDWVPWLRDEFMDKGILERRQQIRRGEVLHALLAWVGDAGEKEPAQVWEEVASRAVSRFPFVADWSDLEAALKKILSARDLAPFFRPRDAEVLCEQEIAYSNGDTGRIDRLIIDKKEVCVVDYKSSRQEAEAGRAQVRRYAQAIRHVFAGRSVRGFLVYVDTATCEEVL